MVASKNINYFLIDGKSDGRIKCTIQNWTGLFYKVPRTYLDECKNIKAMKKTGIYFLFGKNDDDEDCVYVGQARIRKNGEGLLGRVQEHIKDSFYFTDAVMLTTQNNIFGPTEISYLENKFTNLAIEADRYNVKNGNEPNPGTVTEEKESELLEFMEYSKLVMGVLGYKIFIPINNKNELVENEDLYLYLSRRDAKTNKEIKATCKRTSEGFVVLKGSDFCEIDADHIKNKTSIKNIRDKCKNSGGVLDGKLIKDYLFNSPSYAATFVLGKSSNGRTEWKDKDGVTLKEIEEKEIDG